ncbi:rho guanine nucleotide exchange factor 2 isoform X2 [Anticarsia gemmatalis]|uniref:rho guanine nucleotide exchange factor 2 isoform X2 n=1 Tax=Anticarsia gemmatalis TaxID=129554 RepID=UPI003F770D7E
MLGGAVSPGGDDLLTVTVVRDEHGYGMKVSGDNPVYVQSVKEHGAAWRAGLRAGDRILRVDSVPVHHHTHQQVVHMIRANPTTVLTVQQNMSRHKITAPVPVNPEKQRQLEVSKVHTVRLMLEKEQKFIRDLRNEISKVPDVRKQAELQSAEQRCSKLQHEIDTIMAGQPSTPRLAARKAQDKASSPAPNTGFLSGLPRSLSNLTGQSLRNLRHARSKEPAPPLVRQNSDDGGKRHNHTVPLVPTTCLDNVTPPPLPPRSIERPKRNPLSPPPMNPLAMAKPSSSPGHKYYGRYYEEEARQFRRSSHSLDGELEGPQPNSIAMQMSYPLVNAPPPPLQTDNRTGVPVLHMRSRSSPEQLDHDLTRSYPPSPAIHPPGAVGTAVVGPLAASVCSALHKDWADRDTPPPGTPPPPYHTNTQPCSDPQRAIISMEEDDSPASDNSTYSSLFSNLRSVRESKARTAVLLNWLLGERRCACACLLLVLTDGYRGASNVQSHTLRRWAYEIHSTFLVPNAALQLSGVDENMANEIEHVLVNEYEKEELLRNVFRKARQKAKDELSQQLTEFQVKRQVGLGTLYGPEDAVIDKCDVDKAQELVVVEQLMCGQLRAVSRGAPAACGADAHGGHGDTHHTLLAALIAAALCLHCRPASVAAAVGGSRASFLQRDKLYKQRVKQITKQHQQPFVVRGHHLQLQALTSVGHCHHCEHIIWGLAPQAYVCADCKLRVHRSCARSVEEGCCLDGEHHNNRISRFIHERIHSNQPNNMDSNDKKSRKASSTGHFLNMERSFRKTEDEPPWDQTLTPPVIGESRREGSTDEPTAPDGDVDTSDANTKEPDKDNKSSWRSPAGGRGVNRAESCRERDAPRRGKHRNASDPNRLTAHNNHDLEPGAATAPSGSSSSSSLSSRSNESNTVAAEQQASQSDWSDEEEPLAAQWSDSVPPQIRDTLVLCAKVRKRQEVIHELIVSEGSHLRWLRVLGKLFLKPLEHNGLLAQDELRSLFPNLPAVREHHARLYADLRTARSEATNHVVEIRPIADALLNTLGEAGYASCVSKFCRGQRMALDALRERRRKSKELHQFLASREQQPLCGRLQLKDMLACVWQRLTKYQLLLESILKTADSEGESSEDVARLRRAHLVAKDVLHRVDTAIRTAENEHRLRTIQSKLEVRIPTASSSDFEELRRFDLTQHTLRTEGELTLRNDSSKRINVLALMLEDSLVLLQREGDKFLLKPISQQPILSPLIKWDKVLFRPNAAVRNTFFLMNINGVQMHELSANTAPEYASWVKHIQEAPLAKLTELKSTITPSHQPSRSTDDSGVNVSRNPSDASEKSSSTVPLEEPTEPERPADRASADIDEKERDDNNSVEREDRSSVDKDDDKEEKHKPRRPTVGRISTHGAGAAPLEAASSVCVSAPAATAAATAQRAFTDQERLRRLDDVINRALRAKSHIVGAALGVPPQQYTHLADLAVAEALGEVDVSGELRLSRGQLSRSCSEEEASSQQPDLYQLLLAAHAQATQLTRYVARALTVSEADTVAARARAGRCDTCQRAPRTYKTNHQAESFELVGHVEESELDDSLAVTEALERDVRDTLPHDMSDVAEDSAEEALECSGNAALLAARVSTVSRGLHAALSRLLAAAPPPGAERALREHAAVLREQNDALRARARPDHQNTDEVPFPKAGLDPSIQEQPSNGG